jgi:uncharacterized protein DUF2690
MNGEESALRTSSTRHRVARVVALVAVVLTAGLLAPAPAQAAVDVPAGYQMLPGWDLPARVTVRADGSILAEADAAALKSPDFAAAVTGCGSTCDGKSPNTYKYGGSPCVNDATTVKAVYQPGGGYIGAELRYSARCRTAWTRRSTGTIGGDIWVYSYNANGTYRTSYLVDTTAVNYTAMVNDAGLTALACYGYEEITTTPPYPYYKICSGSY